MTKLQRKIYTLIFVGIFFILAPALIFFAKGYRFDTIAKVFVHSGSVIIKSYPKKVDIYIDGKKISNKRLNFINNYYIVNGIRPGRHLIECRKPGYTQWQKEADVHSGISTEFWNVLLMASPNKTLQSYSPQNIQRFYLSPREKNELVLYQKNDTTKTISLFNTKTNNLETLYTDKKEEDTFIPNKEENIEWSSNHKKILIPTSIKNQKNYTVTTIKKTDKSANINLLDIFSKIAPSLLETTAIANEVKDLEATEDTPDENTTLVKNESTEHSEISSTKITKINSTDKENQVKIHQARWIFDSDTEIIVLTENHKLLILNITNPQKSIILDNEVNGFDLAGNHIYYTKLAGNHIWDIKTNHPEKKKIIATISTKQPTGNFLKMIAYDEYRIAIITDKKELYILNNDPEDDSIFFGHIGNNINGVQFSDDGKKLLYWGPNEIFVYMLREWKVQPRRKKGETIFITRFSTPITNVQWMQNFENIIFTNNNLVKMAEMDIRDHINLVNIFQSNSPTEEYEYIYNKDNYVLYFQDTSDKDSQDKQLKSITLLENTGFLNFGN